MKKNSIYMPLVIAFSFAASIIKPGSANAQHPFSHDTSYYVSYPGTLTARVYFSQKYAPFTLPGFEGVKDIQYTPNAKLNMGIGATYHNFTLNVGYGFSFLNNKNEEKGKSKALDLQLHLYRHRWVVDALGIFYKGEYISPKGYGAIANSYYYRPDIKFNLVGAAAYHLSNPERFSYHAAFIQNEWQKKSAGTLLYGGEAYYGTLKGDSALVPQQIKNGFPQDGVNNINFFRVGPGVGYAYTLVIEKHFFISGSLIANLDLNVTSEKGGMKGTNNKVSVNPGAIYKAGIGYNSDTWSLTGTWAGNASWISNASSSEKYFLPTGNFRVMLAKKINLKKH